MAKQPLPKSTFDDLMKAAKEGRGEMASRSPNLPITQSSNHLNTESPNPKISKSKDDRYTRLTFYIRKESDIKVRQKLAGEGKREISDVYQRLTDGWLEGRFEV